MKMYGETRAAIGYMMENITIDVTYKSLEKDGKTTRIPQIEIATESEKAAAAGRAARILIASGKFDRDTETRSSTVDHFTLKPDQMPQRPDGLSDIAWSKAVEYTMRAAALEVLERAGYRDTSQERGVFLGEEEAPVKAKGRKPAALNHLDENDEPKRSNLGRGE